MHAGFFVMDKCRVFSTQGNAPPQSLTQQLVYGPEFRATHVLDMESETTPCAPEKCSPVWHREVGSQPVGLDAATWGKKIRVKNTYPSLLDDSGVLSPSTYHFPFDTENIFSTLRP